MAHILLAEDDGSQRTLLKRGLTNDGHSVVDAQDGQAALEQFMAAPADFDLLISDVEMPGIDGIELARRAIAMKSDVKVLLISGHATNLHRAEDVAGANIRLLAKPSSIDQIRAEISRLIA